MPIAIRNQPLASFGALCFMQCHSKKTIANGSQTPDLGKAIGLTLEFSP